jgi:hypothetical protein
MIAPTVKNFLRKAQADPDLAQRVGNTDTYPALAELSESAGEPATEGALRAAFAARDARMLVRQMIARGLMDPCPLPPTPLMDGDVWKRVAAMDLSPVAGQLVNYLGWTPERAAAIERRYRGFFYLKITLPGGMASPTPEVDEFWHQHIINTRRYAPDCMNVAGQFLHHTFLTPDDPAEAAELSSVWLATWTSYEALFAEPYEGTLGAGLLERWPNP